MRAHDQSSIFSIGEKFHSDYGLLLELHALTLVARSYALFVVAVCSKRSSYLLSSGIYESPLGILSAPDEV